MTWLIFVTMAHAARAPLTAETRVSLGRDGGVVADARRFTLTQRQDGARVIRRLTTWGAGGMGRTVVPASFARTLTRELDQWTRRLARAPRDLITAPCARPIEIARGPRVTPLCLDGVRATERAEFFAWYRRVSSVVE